MNPFTAVIANYENLKLDDTHQKPICLVLRILERNYSSGFTGGNPHRYVLNELKTYAPHVMIEAAEQEWQHPLNH